jgi:branched-chain amino acid transport system substrate-binding protein
MHSRRIFLQKSAAAAACLASGVWTAQAENAPGVTDTEIKIGRTMPYSGPASAYGKIGRTEVAYFRMINDAGGINRRKVNLISLDDGYSPPKTIEQTRRLIEQEQVAFIFGSVGTAANAAIRSYLNDNKIPQLFVASGFSMFADPQHYPWTMGANPSYRTEGRVFARHILNTKPDAKIGVLYQNDDLGRDYLSGVRDALGTDHAAMLIKQVSYEVSDPTVDSQIITLQGAGVDTLIIAANGKATAQAIRKIYDLDWKPERYLGSTGSSITSVLIPAGIEQSKGVITNYWGKDPADARWKDAPDFKEWAAFVAKYMTPSDLIDGFAVYGYGSAALMTYVLRQCGEDLSRENVMHVATSLKDYVGPMGLPGAKANTSPDDYRLVRQLQLARFNGVSWEWFGDILSDSVPPSPACRPSTSPCPQPRRRCRKRRLTP